MKNNKASEDEKRAALKQLFDTMSLGKAEEVDKACRTYMENAMFTKEMIKGYCHGSIEDELDELYDFLISTEARILRKWLIRTGIYVGYAEEDKLMTGRSYIGKAREFIRQNYSDKNLSLDKVCERLGVSNSYFSTIFKRETGESFVEFLTDYRMKKAAEMLTMTNEKSYIIAEKVGYSDPNYFSYVFKKQFGVPPTRFRERYSTDSLSIVTPYSQNQE